MDEFKIVYPSPTKSTTVKIPEIPKVKLKPKVLQSTVQSQIRGQNIKPTINTPSKSLQKKPPEIDIKEVKKQITDNINKKNKIKFRVFVGSLVLNFIFIIILSNILYTNNAEAYNSEKYLYGFNSAWKYFQVIFDEYLANIPNRLTTDGYWKARTWFDEETVSDFKVKTLQSWETTLHEVAIATNSLSLTELAAIKSKLGKTVMPIFGLKITSEFGFRKNPKEKNIGGPKNDFHPGVDIVCDIGTQVLAYADGTVVLSANNYGEYGKCIIIDHLNGVKTLYGHLSKRVSTFGLKVKAGDLIGLTGITGNSTGPHLHFEIRYRDQILNPEDFLSL